MKTEDTEDWKAKYEALAEACQLIKAAGVDNWVGMEFLSDDLSDEEYETILGPFWYA